MTPTRRRHRGLVPWRPIRRAPWSCLDSGLAGNAPCLHRCRWILIEAVLPKRSSRLRMLDSFILRAVPSRRQSGVMCDMRVPWWGAQMAAAVRVAVEVPDTANAVLTAAALAVSLLQVRWSSLR